MNKTTYFFSLWLRRSRHQMMMYLNTYDMTFEPDQIALAALLALAND